MATGLSVQLEGLDQLLKKLDNKQKGLTRLVDAEIHAAAIEITNVAASKAPVDKGVLKRSLHFRKMGPLKYEIVSGARYSAYVEFGTGAGVSIPKGYNSYAAQFKGAGIRRVDKHAKPFFIPALRMRSQLLIKRLKKIIEKW